MTAGYKWRPLEKTTVFGPPSDELVRVTAEHYGVDSAAALKMVEDDHARCEYWANDLYQVEVRKHDQNLWHLNIRRRDGAAIIRDWRHLQTIKNEIVGPECEAIELYPAESRLVDTSNKYHLWAIADPAFRFPVGFDKRDVRGDDPHKTPGMRQRTMRVT